MSVQEYDSKFMKLSCFTSAFVADEKLKMKSFGIEPNPNLKERMPVRQYIYYEDIYDTTVNVERVMKVKNEYYNKQWRNQMRGEQ